MMLTLGADLYTTSKLLGHADVKMTQVYAKIINQKKDDAVNLVNGLFEWPMIYHIMSNLQVDILRVSSIADTIEKQYLYDILL